MSEYSIDIKKFKGETVSKHRIYHPHLPPIKNEDDGKTLKVDDGKAEFQSSIAYVRFVYNEDSGRYEATANNPSTQEMIDVAKNNGFVIATLEKDGTTNYMPLTYSVDAYGSVMFNYALFKGDDGIDVGYVGIVGGNLVLMPGIKHFALMPDYDTKEDVGKVLMIGEDGYPAWVTPSTT